MGDGYVFDAAGVAGLVNHKACKAAFAVGGDRVWGIGPSLMLSNAQKSAGAHTQNPVGWRCKKHDENPTWLDVGSAAKAIIHTCHLNYRIGPSAVAGEWQVYGSQPIYFGQQILLLVAVKREDRWDACSALPS